MKSPKACSRAIQAVLQGSPHDRDTGLLVELGKFLDNLPEPPEGFEYTGKYRPANAGEWRQFEGRVDTCWDDSDDCESMILRKLD